MNYSINHINDCDSSKDTMWIPVHAKYSSSPGIPVDIREIGRILPFLSSPTNHCLCLHGDDGVTQSADYGSGLNVFTL